MNKDITMAVIIPVYNVESYLVQCLESVIKQSVSFDEVILINDGSADNSRLICEEYTSKYDFFRLINQKNRGLSAARNIGLVHVTSEYVLFLDSDDYLRTDTVKWLKDELKKFRQDAIYFDAEIHCEKGYEVDKNYYDRDMKRYAGIRMSGESFFSICYPEKYIVSACMAVYKKETLKASKLLFPEGLYYEDNYFTISFMLKAKNVSYIPEKLYQRRYRKDSITTSTYSEKKFNDHIKIVSLVWEVVCKQKNIFLPENKIFFKVINNYCFLNLKHFRSCADQNIILSCDVKNRFYSIVKTYESLVEQYYFDDKIENLALLNDILRNLKEIVIYCQKYKIKTKLLIKKIGKKQKKFYKMLLYDLPLNVQGYKVGIYGTGKHTEGLLAIYESLIGKIICDLIFIDSYQKNGGYLDRKIIQYQQIDNSFDLIIISSFIYRQEMIENIRKINKEVPVYTFYDMVNEDIFSQITL